jgi:hypothetical protein
MSPFNNGRKNPLLLKGKDNIKGNLQLELPGNWSVSPQSIPLIR